MKQTNCDLSSSYRRSLISVTRKAFNLYQTLLVTFLRYQKLMIGIPTQNSFSTSFGFEDFLRNFCTLIVIKRSVLALWYESISYPWKSRKSLYKSEGSQKIAFQAINFAIFLKLFMKNLLWNWIGQSQIVLNRTKLYRITLKFNYIKVKYIQPI